MSKSSKINMRNLVTIFSAAILVGTETVGIGLAFGWALGGFFELSKQGTLILEVIFASLGALTLWYFYKHAVKIEPIRE